MPSVIERKLVLVAWCARQLGFNDNRDMLEALTKMHEEWTDGMHPVLSNILSRPIPYDRARLMQYNTNIYGYLAAINLKRDRHIRLKYFQYLSALITELLLDNIAQAKAHLIQKLNEFVYTYRALSHGELEFKESDLNKLAIWGATGCGKTLLMHLHYYQFLNYRQDLFVPDNILLVTPNEALSAQHMEELEQSGIPCARVGTSNLMADDNPVRVIEITKIAGNRSRKRPKFLPEDFEGRNLVFADEGHKGAGGEAWFEARRKLAANGFTFEYSATFGQALKAADKDALHKDYFKHIAFDYSYAYFYSDGYGKDFKVVNLRDRFLQGHRRDLMLLGNLMALCEQHLIYETRPEEVKSYNLERPLLLFLGSTVSSGRTRFSDGTEKNSDVFDLIEFLRRVVRDRNADGAPWTHAAIKEILSGKAILDAEGNDVFGGKFAYLKKQCGDNPASIYQQILKHVFNVEAGSPANLRFHIIAKDQLGLKVGDQTPYFGVVYVGNISVLKKRLTEKLIPQDRITESLFEGINRPDSSINLLIGARKFIEGWDSWRVSGMGLLNVGSNEGPSIIQLFGRGVRLKGQGLSLKRSGTGLANTNPVKLLEQLNIFGINADYVDRFHTMLKKEGVVDKEEIELDVRKQAPLFNLGLYIPHFPAEEEFHAKGVVEVRRLKDLQVRLRTSFPATTAASDQEEADRITSAPEGTPLEDSILACIDEEELKLQLLEDKFLLERHNILFNEDGGLRAILKQACLFIDEADQLKLHQFADRTRFQRLAYLAIKKYVERLYRREQKNWETQNMDFELVQEDHDNVLTQYKLSIAKKDEELIRQVKTKIQSRDPEVEKYLYEKDGAEPHHIYFDKHLYHPLLIKEERIQVFPAPLVESERKFVELLRSHVADVNFDVHKQIALLRNMGRGRGVGFYEDEGFYPDFILWIKDPQQQRIVFVEPHGLMLADEDYKHTMHRTLRRLSKQLRKKDVEGPNLSMDCYILSKTPHSQLMRLGRHKDKTKEAFEAENILFLEDGIQCIAKLFNDIR